MMQRGCFILNSWGYGPYYRYNLFVRGPFSEELAEDYCEMKNYGNQTNVPDEIINNLSAIMNKGIDYAEAYVILLSVKENNPGRTNDEILNRVLEIKPRLRTKFMEISPMILN